MKTIYSNELNNVWVQKYQEMCMFGFSYSEKLIKIGQYP